MPVKKRVAAFCSLMIIAAFVMSACGQADISSYANEKITVTGLNKEFTITPKELLELDCIDIQASGQSQKGVKTVKGHGPTLKTFVESKGYSLSDFKSIRFTAGDDYTLVLGKVTWDKSDVVMAVTYGNQALDKDHRPLRLIIPGAEAGNWIYNIKKIEFTLNK